MTPLKSNSFLVSETSISKIINEDVFDI